MNSALHQRKLVFRRVNDAEQGATLYLLGFSDEVPITWQPSPTTAEAVGVLHRVTASRGAYVDVSHLAPDCDAGKVRKRLRRAAKTIEEACPALACVLGQVTVIRDDRLLASLRIRSSALRIET